MFYIIFAALIYSIVILLAAVASRNANVTIISVIMSIAATVTLVITAVPHTIKEGFIGQKTGGLYAIAAGIGIGLFTLLLNKGYETNKVAIVAPIVFGGAIFLSAILSNIFFKEKIGLIQGAGLTLLGLGLIIVIYARVNGK